MFLEWYWIVGICVACFMAGVTTIVLLLAYAIP
jgi:hypothetical protein